MTTEDEIRRVLHPEAPPEPWWPYILGGICAILALVLIFVPMGVLK